MTLSPRTTDRYRLGGCGDIGVPEVCRRGVSARGSNTTIPARRSKQATALRTPATGAWAGPGFFSPPTPEQLPMPKLLASGMQK